MFSLKHILRVAIPAASLVLGATLYAGSRSNDCAHPSAYAKIMQFAGLGQIQPCEIINFNGTEICAKIGHHCNVGNGPGKCENVVDANNNMSCQCVGK